MFSLDLGIKFCTAMNQYMRWPVKPAPVQSEGSVVLSAIVVKFVRFIIAFIDGKLLLQGPPIEEDTQNKSHVLLSNHHLLLVPCTAIQNCITYPWTLRTKYTHSHVTTDHALYLNKRGKDWVERKCYCTCTRSIKTPSPRNSLSGLKRDLSTANLTRLHWGLQPPVPFQMTLPAAQWARLAHSHKRQAQHTTMYEKQRAWKSQAKSIHRMWDTIINIHVAELNSQPVYTTGRIALNRFALNQFNYRRTFTPVVLNQISSISVQSLEPHLRV